ncbi:Alpha-(1 3)-fucosyltransferase 7 [Mactra antiquata]
MRIHPKRITQRIIIILILFIAGHIFIKWNNISSENTAPYFKQLSGLRASQTVFIPTTIGITSSNITSVENGSAKIKHKILWPDKHYFNNDRIINQLNFKPNMSQSNSQVPLKTILLVTSRGHWNTQTFGQQTFLDQKCLVNTCALTKSREVISTADAVIIHQSSKIHWTKRPRDQIWILYMLESPENTVSLKPFGNVFNWTATYRHDSDIVTPYEKFVPYDENVKFLPQNKNYAVGKTKMVAWFASNCKTKNRRKEYALELAKYIHVDIYGHCGNLKCPKKDKDCLDVLNTDYKFYLSFENSNCRDYITEKFFINGLQHDVIPIVMGAAPEDYARAAPPHSFIHVDEFDSPEELAQYLHKLDKNDDLYNDYFRWKNTGTFINTYFWCRVCALLHETSRESQSYRDLEKWWRGDGVCIGKDNWRRKRRKSKYIVEDFLN